MLKESKKLQRLFTEFWGTGEEDTRYEKCKEIYDVETALPHFSLHKFRDSQPALENLIQSDLMILIYDDTIQYNNASKDVFQLKHFYERLESTYCCFLSASQEGLKVIFRFDNPVVGLTNYHRLYDYYKSILLVPPFNPKYCNPFSTLTCSVGYDPKIYVNKNAILLKVNVADPDSIKVYDRI
jgi:hypothetical protein